MIALVTCVTYEKQAECNRPFHHAAEIKQNGGKKNKKTALNDI